MRLTCPNCGAQYEVDPEVIPASGRDVQCSNCGHTWYQRSQKAALDISQDPPEPLEETQESEEQPVEAADEEAPVADAPAEDPVEEETDEEEPSEAPKPRQMDPEVADILREEADQEREKRAADADAAPAIETQTDLGLEGSAAETPPNIHERMARLRGMDDELGATAAASAAATGANSRKELLPDIEEINSSLAPGQDADDVLPARDPQQAYRGGFRRGFSLVIILFGIMLLVYIYAPQIVDLNPQTEPVLSAYVDWVNRMRDGLDAFMSNAAERLTRLLASINASD